MRSSANPSPPSSPTGGEVIRSDRAGTATLTINRPEKLNALSGAVFEALRRHLDDLADDGDVRCVVLEGAGRAFSAGLDLESISGPERRLSRHFAPETIDRLAGLGVPTVARVHGFCLTGALELALACDLIVASSSARLGDTHGRWGLAPAWGMTVRLPERVGVARAKQLMFTARIIDADEAAAIGLVDVCVPDEELDATVDTLAQDIGNNSAGTNFIVKRLLADRASLSPQERLQRERRVHYGLPVDMRRRMQGAGR